MQPAVSAINASSPRPRRAMLPPYGPSSGPARKRRAGCVEGDSGRRDWRGAFVRRGKAHVHLLVGAGVESPAASSRRANTAPHGVGASGGDIVKHVAALGQLELERECRKKIVVP